MVFSRYMKLVISTLMIVSVFFVAGVGRLWAFSVERLLTISLSISSNMEPGHSSVPP